MSQLFVTTVAAGGQLAGAVAVQAALHGVGKLLIRVRVTFAAGVAGGGVLAVVEGDGIRQWGAAHPAQGLTGMGRVVRICRGVQGEQAGI